MDEHDLPTPAERADAVATRILAETSDLDHKALALILRAELQEAAQDERRRCADEIGRHTTYQGQGNHFAGILRRGLPRGR